MLYIINYRDKKGCTHQEISRWFKCGEVTFNGEKMVVTKITPLHNTRR